MSLETTEPLTYGRALRQAGSGATALVTGTGGLGYLLGKQGVTLLGAGVQKVRAARSGAPTEDVASAAPTGRRRLVLGGAAFALLAAGAAFFSISRRRKAAPPVAEAPPSLSPSVNGSAPTPAVEQAPTSP